MVDPLLRHLKRFERHKTASLKASSFRVGTSSRVCRRGGRGERETDHLKT